MCYRNGVTVRSVPGTHMNNMPFILTTAQRIIQQELMQMYLESKLKCILLLQFKVQECGEHIRGFADRAVISLIITLLNISKPLGSKGTSISA